MRPVARAGWTAALIVGALAGGVALAQLEKGESWEGFRVPEYEKDGFTLKSQIIGDQAKVLSETDVEITNFKIEMFKGGVVETRVTAPHCVYNRQTGSAQSPNAIRIARGNMVISGAAFIYDARDQQFVIQTNARVVFKDIRRQMKAGVIPGVKP